MTEKRAHGDRLPELNWIRGIAALLVVLYHYTTRYQDVFGQSEDFAVTFPWGCGAVNVFFLLSGFLSAMTLREDTRVLDYLKKRAVRLYPAYWACLLLTGGAMLLLWRERFVGIPALLVNLTMLQSFLGVAAVDGAYWTLMYELQFYVYIAFLLLLRKGKWLRPLALIGTVLSAVLFALAPTLGGNLLFKLARFALLGEYGITFFCGILLCSLKKDPRDALAWLGMVACLVQSYFIHSTAYFVCLLVTVGALLAVCFLHTERHGRYLAAVDLLDKRVFWGLSFVAGISFPLYLLHQNIGIAILSHLRAAGLTSEWWILVPITVSSLLAWAVSRFVERPAGKLLKKKGAA